MTSAADNITQAWRYQQAGDAARAEAVFRDILAKEPKNARAWFGLGVASQAQKRPEDAVVFFRRALQIRPEEGGGYFYLGNALLELRRLPDAAAAYRRCLELEPRHAEALANLGFTLAEQDKPREAVACYRRAVQLRPDSAQGHHNLGNLLRDLGDLEGAARHYEAALKSRPDFASALANLGAALAVLGRSQEGVRHLEAALRLRPDHAETHTALGAALSTLGRFKEAIACYERATSLAPDFAEAHWNLSLSLLLRGHYERGLAEYEWRWRRRNRTPPSIPKPRWDGAPLDGRAILLYSEQGLGDTLHFVRYAQMVKKRGGVVLVRPQRPLLRILASCPGIDRLIAPGEPLPDFAVHAPLMSLPYLFGTRPETIPAPVPYLHADPELVEHWRQQLAPVRGLRVGIAWQGSRTHAWDHHRSIPPEHFETLARVEGVRLISLQKGPGAERAGAADRRAPFLSLGPQLDEAAGPFMDTAAVIRNLDLVITADTAIAHLAGALGAPVWVALCASPDWRWLLDRADSPWYPTMRLFRQAAPGDWAGTFARIADALRQLSAERGAAAVIEVEVSVGELLDKLTILEIKSERIADPAALANVRAELAVLRAARDRAVRPSEELARLTAELRAVNEALWQVEDDLRLCERAQDFGPHFVELARSVYRHNDRRGALKRRLNGLLGSRLVEEKCYATYPAE